MNFYMFDVDETLEVSYGPVKLEQLLNLKKEGHIIGLCGNWAVVTHNLPGWHTVISAFGSFAGLRKFEYLGAIKAFCPADRYIMVGNVNPSNAKYSDKGEAILAGWEFVEEKDFKEGIK